jgi:hypothetical protein
MNRTLLVCAAVLVLDVSLATAQGDIRLGWGDCGTAPHTRNAAFACDNNTSSFSLIVSFRLDDPLSNYVGCSSVIDYAVASTIASKPWWQFESGCRNGSLAPSTVGTVAGCTNPHPAGSNQAGGIAFEASPFLDPLHSRRIRVDWAMDRGSNLAGGAPRYAGQNLVLNTLNTVYEVPDPPGPSPCPGCEQRACFNLWSMEIGSPDLPPPGTLLLATPNQTSVSWQHGSVWMCQGTPTRNATWGSIKSLYR